MSVSEWVDDVRYRLFRLPVFRGHCMRLTLTEGTLVPYVLPVTARCDLNCLGCSLDIGTSAPDEGQEFVALIRDGRFFERYPYRRAYHIVGGDPFALKYLEQLLMFLHQSKVRVTLWIHGARPGVEW